MCEDKGVVLLITLCFICGFVTGLAHNNVILPVLCLIGLGGCVMMCKSYNQGEDDENN